MRTPSPAASSGARPRPGLLWRFWPARPLALATVLAAMSGGLAAPTTAQAQAPAWQLAEGLSANGPSGATVWGTAVNAAGDVFVAGDFTGTAAFGSFTLTNAGSFGTDAFVAKWSSASQSWVWATKAGGTGFDGGRGIAVSGANVYVTGSVNNDAANSTAVSFDGQALPGSGASANNQVFVAKYVDNGSSATLSWVTAGGGSGTDSGEGLAVSGANVYVTGSFMNNTANVNGATFGGQPLAGATTSAFSTDVFVVKYVDNGATVALGWATAGGGTGNDGGRGLAVSGANVYVVGGFQNTAANGANTVISGQALPGLAAGSTADIFLAKFVDAGGAAAAGWAVAGGGTGTDSGGGVAVSGANVYLTGAFQNTAANVNSVSFGGQPLAGTSSATVPDVVTAKYVDNGASATFGWATAGGGTGTDSGLGIAARGTSVYVTGRFQNSATNGNGVTFGGQPLNGLAAAAFNNEVFLVKYVDNGPAPALGWSTVGGGASSAEIAYSVAVAGNKVYLGGQANGTTFFSSLALTGTSLRGFIAGLTDPLPAPTLTSISPATAPVGTTVTLTGTEFTGATGVRFNGTAATFTVNSATSITATVPAGATTGNVTVTTPGGTSINNVPFTVGLPDLVVSTVLSVPQGASYNSVTILAGGVLTSGNLGVAGQLVIQNGGELRPGGIVSGPGSFELQAGGKLTIGAGMDLYPGRIGVTGSVTLSSDALYAYTTGARGTFTTGLGLPATVRELIVTATRPLTLSQPLAVTHALRLTSGTLITNDQLTLLSTATRQAYVVHGAGTTSGTVTVQRYVGGPTAQGYRHLSSPVQATTVADLATAGFAPRVNAAYNALPYVAPPVATFPNVLGFAETRGGTTSAYSGFTTGYYSPVALTDNLTSGRGWSVYMAGGQTPDFVGALTSGPVNQSLTVTGTNTSPNAQKAGWHLLGNPYPQPIDWDLATVPPGMSASISVFRTTGGNNGQYLLRANGLGTLTDGLLPLGQAFFARATAPTTFTFTDALRVEANPGPVARPAADTRPTLRLALTGTGADAITDETFVYVQAGATLGQDLAFDGLRPGRNTGTVPTLASVIGGQEAGINALPETVLTGTTETVVELTAVLPQVGTYTLAVAGLEGFAGTSVEVLDRLTGTRYDLTQTPALTLTATRAHEEVAGRFAVLLNGRRALGTAAPAPGTAALALFPNPAAGGGAVRVTGLAAGTRVTVLDVAGRRVATLTTDATGSAELAVAGWAAGVYGVRAPDGRTTRLVVE